MDVFERPRSLACAIYQNNAGRLLGRPRGAAAARLATHGPAEPRRAFSRCEFLVHGTRCSFPAKMTRRLAPARGWSPPARDRGITWPAVFQGAPSAAAPQNGVKRTPLPDPLGAGSEQGYFSTSQRAGPTPSSDRVVGAAHCECSRSYAQREAAASQSRARRYWISANSIRERKNERRALCGAAAAL